MSTWEYFRHVVVWQLLVLVLLALGAIVVALAIRYVLGVS